MRGAVFAVLLAAGIGGGILIGRTTCTAESHTHAASREWTEVIQSQDRRQCRWELHRGIPVVSIGQWHPCTDKELGA